MKKRLPRLADDVLPKLQVPVQRLVEDDRAALLDYYRRLSLTDRAALFGFPLPDDKLAVYVNRLDFAADGHFAARGAASVLIGVGHCIVFDGQGVLNVHVAHGYRRRGIGTALGGELTRFGRARALAWLRAYFNKTDPLAASLARALGMVLNFGLDRFYAELALEAPRGSVRRGMPAPLRRALQSADEQPEQAEAAAPA
jgi:GNAT superfamily N-acetyltransferase